MPQTLANTAYLHLRRQMLSGEIKPGHWLRKRNLAADLNMSPTPVVEAIRLLEQEGLVESLPKWGSRVRALTCDELEQILWMRSDIEAHVVRRVAERAGQRGPELDELDRLARQADEKVTAVLADCENIASRVGTTIESDLLFHTRLAACSGLELMRAEINRLFLLGHSIRMLTATDRLRVPHLAIMQAIRDGDPAQAEAAVRRHLEGKLLGDLPQLRARFGDGPVRFDAVDEALEANTTEPLGRLVPAGN